jgi:aquaporin Z
MTKDAADGTAQPTATGRVPWLRGKLHDVAASHAKLGGWHPVEWMCEFAGTLFQLFLAFHVVAALETPCRRCTPPCRHRRCGWSSSARRSGSSQRSWRSPPLGRRSGAHLNPAVTIGFWAKGTTHVHDLVGYLVAQFAGASAAAAAFVGTAGAWAETAGYARTEPRDGISELTALGIEVTITFCLVLAILASVSSSRTARWTPAAATLALAVLIPLGGPPTGASMNPARTFGPDLASGSFPTLWIYLVGPAIGALLAAAAFPLLASGRDVLTAKLFHDHRYRSTHATRLAPH